MLGLIKNSDPTGFYAGSLHEKLENQLIEEQDKLQKEGLDLKKE